MANLLYKGHLIVAFARFDEDTRLWIPIADVSWTSHDEPISHTISGPPNQFARWADAEEFMTATAKAWIDEHL
jgi:hypothetical protein